MITDFLAGKIGLLLFMVVCAVSDFRTRSVGIMVFFSAFVLEAAFYTYLVISGYEVRWISVVLGLIPGCIIAILSLVTKGGMGLGDAFFFGVTGLALGGLHNMLLFSGGMILSGVYGLVMVMIRTMGGRPVSGLRFPLLPLIFPVGVFLLVLLTI